MLPKRGEIWLVNLDPTVGAEIQKTRPAIVISSDYIGKLPLKLVVPITDWCYRDRKRTSLTAVKMTNRFELILYR
jgi:mRNA-degrading endonuclease toxin of MazEF toxin-antitoxin module